MGQYFKKKAETAKRIIGLGELKRNTRLLKDAFKKVCGVKVRTGSVDPVSVASLGLSEEHIQTARKAWQRILAVFLVLATLSFITSVVLLLQGDVEFFIVFLAVTALFLAQAFKFHFWLFQLQQGRLGCTWKEWLNHFLKKS